MDKTYVFIIASYLIGISIYGWYLNKKYVKSSNDFVRGGQRLPFFILVGTLLATWMGAGMVTGTANFIYTQGPIAGIFHLISEPIGILILALFLAKKAREKAKTTVPELIESKYGRLAGILVSICIILSYVGIVSYQFIAGGHILNLTLGVSVETGTLISTVLVVFLAVVGGLVSVAYTDAIGTLVIFGAMIIALPVVLSKCGGLTNLISQIPPEKMSVTGKLNTIQLLGYIFPTIFLVLGEQNIYQRFSASESAETARKSGMGFFWLGLLLDILVLGLCTPAILMFPVLENPDTAFFQVALSIPKVLGGLMLASTVALCVTSADSYLLSAATNITYDFWLKNKKEQPEDKKIVFVTRLTVVILGLISLILGKFFPSILAMQMYAFSMYGAAITPAFLACLFWDRATKAGGLTSIILGGATVLIWELVLKNPMGLNSIVVAGPLSIISLIVVSLLTHDDEDVEEEIIEEIA